MVQCLFCKRLVQKKKDLVVLSFPIWKSFAPLPAHLSCYVKRIGKSNYQNIAELGKYRSSSFLPSTDFIAKNGIPIDLQKEKSKGLQWIGIMAPFLAVGAYLVYLLPALIIPVSPMFVIMAFLYVTLLYRLRVCRNIMNEVEAQ